MKRLLAFLARRRHEGPWYFLLCVPVLIGAVIALAWPRLHDLRLRYDYLSLRKQQDRLLRENRRLRLARAKLRSLTHIEEIARRDLGLTDPKAGQVIWVEAPGLAEVQGGQR